MRSVLEGISALLTDACALVMAQPSIVSTRSRDPPLEPSIVVTPLALQPGKGASYPWGYGTIGKYQPQQFRFFFDTSTNISFALIEGQLLNYRKVLATSYPPTILRALAVTEESPRTRICILDRS